MSFQFSRILEFPIIWRLFRFVLDVFFGVYRKRISILKKWGVLENSPSVLDVGCGMGQFSAITDGKYLGIDLSEKYINQARRNTVGQNKKFMVGDVSELVLMNRKFDTVLMADIVHHLDETTVSSLLKSASKLAKDNIIIMEPLKEQTNLLGKFILGHDRGGYVRNHEQLLQLITKDGLKIHESKEIYLGPIKNIIFNIKI